MHSWAEARARPLRTFIHRDIWYLPAMGRCHPPITTMLSSFRMPALIYTHLSWTTFNRRPMIGPAEEAFLKAFLPTEAEKHGSTVMALGMVSDHVHMLLRFGSVIAVPKLGQSLKGSSSRLSKRTEDPNCRGLRWAKGYDLRSVSPKSVPTVIEYVRTQAARHPDRAIR